MKKKISHNIQTLNVMNKTTGYAGECGDVTVIVMSQRQKMGVIGV